MKLPELSELQAAGELVHRTVTPTAQICWPLRRLSLQRADGSHTACCMRGQAAELDLRVSADLCTERFPN